MTIQQTGAVMDVLTVAYPQFYRGKDQRERQNALKLWAEMFSEDPLELVLAAVKRLIARAQALDMPISFDPNLRPQLWESEKKMVSTLNFLAESAETVLPGLGEGKILTGRDTPEGVADFYHAMGVKNVVVKLGKDGAFFSEKDGESGYAPEFPVRKKVDTVGAGDGFAAGVISALAEGLPLCEAAKRGNVIGAIQITNKSDNEGLPTSAELEAVIRAGIA